MQRFQVYVVQGTRSRLLTTVLVATSEVQAAPELRPEAMPNYLGFLLPSVVRARVCVDFQTFRYNMYLLHYLQRTQSTDFLQNPLRSITDSVEPQTRSKVHFHADIRHGRRLLSRPITTQQAGTLAATPASVPSALFSRVALATPISASPPGHP
jgi:hypothetical protein